MTSDELARLRAAMPMMSPAEVREAEALLQAMCATATMNDLPPNLLAGLAETARKVLAARGPTADLLPADYSDELLVGVHEWMRARAVERIEGPDTLAELARLADNPAAS